MRNICRYRPSQLSVLLPLMLVACQGDLSVPPGNPGNLTGVWAGTLQTGDALGAVELHLEQRGDLVRGVVQTRSDHPTEPGAGWLQEVQSVDADAPCDVSNGTFVEGVLSYRYPASPVDLIIKLSYDASTETLIGRWQADTNIADEQGAVVLQRVSYIPSRSLGMGGDVATLLGCYPLTQTLCTDGLDNDGDGLVDLEDPACVLRLHGDRDKRRLLIGNDESLDPPCSDELDNDGDGLVDDADPQCDDNTGENGGASPCADGADNDGDGLVDLEDPGCAGDPTHLTEVLPMCQDGLDNDGDGLVDDADPECATGHQETASQLSECANGYDDDGDGLIDLQDPACRNDPERREGRYPQCDDGVDNNGDGLIDLEDPGCIRQYYTNETGDYVADGGIECDDGADNDGDGLMDAEDPDCLGYTTGEEMTDLRQVTHFGYCDNGIDDDGDGLIDGDDPGCLISLRPDFVLSTALRSGVFTPGFEGVPPCLDGIDNDGDGLVDLADPDCRSGLDIGEDPPCSNGFDDDGDGLTDLEDPGCAGDPNGPEVRPECQDGVDNDGDGLSDADDPHCTFANDNAESAACSDHIDNDGDGLFDLADPDCQSGDDDREGIGPHP